MAIQQAQPLKHFPSGDSRALLELATDPSDLTARLGLTFEERCDDLDRYRLAAVALADGSQAWLVKYRGEEDAGTTVYVDAAADPIATKTLVLGALALSDADVRWLAPDLAAAGAR